MIQIWIAAILAMVTGGAHLSPGTRYTIRGEPGPPPPAPPAYDNDGRYFAWVYRIMPWSEPHLEPQLILDPGMQDYILKHNKSVRLIAKHILPVEHYDLTLDELRVRYPAPEWHQHDDRERKGSMEL